MVFASLQTDYCAKAVLGCLWRTIGFFLTHCFNLLTGQWKGGGMNRKSLTSIILLLVFLVPGSALADLLTPSSYDMIGGRTSSDPTKPLWDLSYPQTADYQALSGGLGDLTDGLTTTSNWNTSDYIRYVGWHDSYLPNPTIDFYFPAPVTIDDIAIHFNAGYVPGSVDFTMGMTTHNFPVIQGSGSGDAHWIYFDLPSSLTGDSIQVKLNDRTFADVPRWPTDWILLTEVEFQGSPGAPAPVPEPATVLLLGTGLVGLAGFRKKFKK
jgi:hypothetical protein